jgi:hypothetical protein
VAGGGARLKLVKRHTSTQTDSRRGQEREAETGLPNALARAADS